MEHSPAFLRQARHLLRLLSREDARLCLSGPLPGRLGDFVLECAGKRGRETFAASLAEAMTRNDWLVRDDSGRRHITDAGRKHLSRAEAEARGFGDDAFRRQHFAIADQVRGASLRDAPLRNLAESVITLLARRRKDGSAFLDRSEVDAGERLRIDMTMAAMVPRMTTDLSLRGAGGSSTPITETIVAARQRVNRALGDVGPELNSILVDICGLNMGLETVEERHAWPQRSGKLVLKLALQSLARHYQGKPSFRSGRA